MLINMLSQAVMVNSEAINRLLLKHAGNPERSPRVSVNEANNLVAGHKYLYSHLRKQPVLVTTTIK